MDKIARVRAEIERRIKLYDGNNTQELWIGNTYRAVLSFLDTLSEEPDTPEFPETFEICLYDGRTPDNEKCTECSTTCSVRKEEPDKSLEEAAYKYSFDSKPSIYGQVDVIDAFKAGAEWQKEQDQPITGNSLEQEWLRYVDRRKKECRGELPFLGEYGWLQIARHFAEWQKSQMLKDAVEGEICGRVYDHINVRFADGVCKYLEPKNISHIPADVSKYNIGDKVRIVVLKEEE